MKTKELKVEDFATLEYNENSKILHIKYPNLIKLTAEKALAIVAEGLKLTQKDKFGIISDIRNVTEFSFDAIKFFFNLKAEKIYANAIITDATRTEKFFDTMQKIHKPKIKIQFFFNKKDAREWLLNQM